MKHIILNEEEFESIITTDPNLPLLVKGPGKSIFTIGLKSVNNILNDVLGGDNIGEPTEETNYISQLDEILA